MRKPLSNAQISGLIKQFPNEWKCWKVGLRYGSCLYFEMGRRLKEELRKGEFTESGSASLTFEGYEWAVMQRQERITDARDVTNDIADLHLTKEFKGQRLEELKFNVRKKQLVARFSDDLLVEATASDSGKYRDKSLCLLVVPSGLVIGCDPKHGFYWDGSISSIHAYSHSMALLNA